MKPQVFSGDDSPEYYFQERCYISELSNSDNDPQMSVARARVEPGVTTRWHRLRDTSERYCILSGTGLVELGDSDPQAVSAGDMVLIPALCPQRICNTGDTDLVFLAICTPRFVVDCYEDIETEIQGEGTGGSLT